MHQPETKIRVAITDDHPVVRDGLRRMLELHSHITVIADYPNGKSLLAGIAMEQPDVLLLDLQLPDISGTELVTAIKSKYPHINILMLTGNASSYSIKMMLQAGASGYLLKNSEQSLLLKAIESVNQQELFLSSEVQQKLNNLVAKNNTISNEELTPREKDVLRLIAQEKSSKEIGEQLHIGYRTVENYRLVIMQKLGVKNMVGMVKKALMLGLIDES